MRTSTTPRSGPTGVACADQDGPADSATDRNGLIRFFTIAPLTLAGMLEGESAPF